MKKLKFRIKRSRLAALAVGCLMFLFLCSCNSADTTDDKKFVGSRDTEGFSADMPVYESADELFEASDCVVIASFSKKPRNVLVSSEHIYMPPNEETGFEGLDMISDNYSTKYVLNVSEVIKGDIQGDTIVLAQLGKYESDEYETKLKPNTKYLLFLGKRNYDKEFSEEFTEERAKEFNSFFENDKILYQTVCSESGIFEIRKGNALYAYADFGFAPSFDGEKLDALLAEFE